jgi:hypothetical protein
LRGLYLPVQASSDWCVRIVCCGKAAGGAFKQVKPNPNGWSKTRPARKHIYAELDKGLWFVERVGVRSINTHTKLPHHKATKRFSPCIDDDHACSLVQTTEPRVSAF